MTWDLSVPDGNAPSQLCNSPTAANSWRPLEHQTRDVTQSLELDLVSIVQIEQAMKKGRSEQKE